MTRDEKYGRCSIALVVLLISFPINHLWGYSKGLSRAYALAAQTECARYHPDTAKFEWLKENE
jgi:hypothetical protein